MKTTDLWNLLPDFLSQALACQGIVQPTPVQQAVIAEALNGRDILATAPTGTGKTLAFLLPLAARLQLRPEENILILSPTRELAQQTFNEWETLTAAVSLPATLVVGGDNIHKQFAALRRHPRMIIATPGRVIDHLQRKSIDLRRTHTLVLDETDRMLDMGFIEDMRRIVAALPQPRHTLLFSATLPEEINQLAREFLVRPLRVKIGSVSSPVEGVLQEIVRVEVREKLPQLLHELNTREGSVLIFVRTRHGAERLAKQLKLYGQKCNALHGDLRQNRRRQVLEFFRNQTVRVLIATDIAARGIDVSHIAHVINYDLPQSAQDYIHRIGRTGRAGAVGSSISFIAGNEDKWKEICQVTRFTLPVKTVQKTIGPLPAPKFVAQEEGAAHSISRRQKKRQTPLPPAAPKASTPALTSPKEARLPAKEFSRSRPSVISSPKVRPSQVTPVTENPAFAFRTVKVGVSKKKLGKLTAPTHQPRTKQKRRFPKKKRR